MKWIYESFVKLIPIIIGYLPVAISFTLIAGDAGLNNVEIIAMSLLVLGAASQIAAIPLIDGGYGIFYIAFITALINFRHAALAATLSPSLRDFSFRELAVFSYGLTDEAFAIHSLDIATNNFSKRIAIAINVGTHLIWVLATAVGCYAGFFIINNLHFIRLDFALPAMFLSIIVLFIKTKTKNLDRQLIKTLFNYALIILATIALTLILLFYSLKSLAFFVPALIVTGVVALKRPTLGQQT